MEEKEFSISGGVKKRLLFTFLFSQLLYFSSTQAQIAPVDAGNDGSKWDVVKEKVNSGEDWQKGMTTFREGSSEELQQGIEEKNAKDAATAKANEAERIKNFEADKAEFEKNNADKTVEKKTDNSALNKSRWKMAGKKYKEVEKAQWKGESKSCQEAKSKFVSVNTDDFGPERWKNPFQIPEDKLANKRVGKAYSPKFKGAMLFQECQGFAHQDWDILVGNKSSGPETWAGSWQNLAKIIMTKLKPYALTPEEWDMAREQLRESKTFQQISQEKRDELAKMGVESGLPDETEGNIEPGNPCEINSEPVDAATCETIKFKIEKLQKTIHRKKKWMGGGDEPEGFLTPVQKLKNIKKHLTNVYPDLNAHFAKVRKCAALIHLTSTMDYNNVEYTTPGNAEGGDNQLNSITMNMQMAQSFTSNDGNDPSAALQDLQLTWSCATSGAETQDFPECRKSISMARAFQVALTGLDVGLNMKRKADSKRRANKVKCQAEYLKNPDMELTVSTDPENPGCAEFITQKGKTNEELMVKALEEKEKLGDLSEEDKKLLEVQKARVLEQKKRSTNLSVQRLALEAQKEGIEDEKKYAFTKMGFYAAKLAAMGSSFSKFPDKGKLYGLCKQGLQNLADVEKENKTKYENWLNEFLEPYKVFDCHPIPEKVLEFTRGNIHGGEGFEVAEETQEQPEGEESAAIASKDKASTDDPCQDTLGNSSIALIRNTAAREQLKAALMGVGKDAMVHMMKGMIYNNQANVVQAALDGTKALEQPFVMTPILRENLNKLCNGTPIEPKKICDATKNAMKKGVLYPSQLKISFQGGGATKIASRKRLKLGVNRKAANINSSGDTGGVDSMGSGDDSMGEGGEETASGEAPGMQGLGEVASAEGGGGGEAGGPGLIEGGGEEGGGGDPGQAAIGDEGGSDLQGGELQVAQFQGGGKMAGGGVGSDMGGMVSGGDGGQMNFRGPAGDGGLAGRAKGIFKIISKRYKSINDRNKLLKYEKK